MVQVLSPPETLRATRSAARAIEAVKVFGTGDAAVRALDGITVDFEEARFNAIMGPSGSGKSTLLHCLAGLDRLTSGHVFLGDIDVTSLDEKKMTKLRRDSIGFIFQFFNLVPTLTAEENITLPLALAGHKPDAAWMDKVIDSLAMRERLSHTPSELSGGQQQRVAGARALVSKPKIIFADEPTGNLDTSSGAEMLSFLRQAVDDFGQTIVMVTHDPIAASHADRIVFLVDGRVVDEMHSPTPSKILDEMKRLGG